MTERLRVRTKVEKELGVRMMDDIEENKDVKDSMLRLPFWTQ